MTPMQAAREASKWRPILKKIEFKDGSAQDLSAPVFVADKDARRTRFDSAAQTVKSRSRATPCHRPSHSPDQSSPRSG